MRRAAVIALLLLLAAPALAVLPQERLADPALEARARELSLQLRCQVCQNQSIDDSNAPLAADLRRLVRERLTAGDSDRAVLDFMVQRYGDYVLLNPPVKRSTWALWFGPAALVLVAGFGLTLYYRRRRPALATAPQRLAPEEEAQLRRILDDKPTAS
jgi:cytochrome c-type biogenesis protein CcmH